MSEVRRRLPHRTDSAAGHEHGRKTSRLRGRQDALRAVRAESMDILQRGTVNAGAPVCNTRESTAAWLRRFETDENGLFAAKAALLDASPLLPENALPNPL